MSIEKAPEATGTKHDNGKPPITLLPLRALWEAARVMGFGATKYARHNWLGGIAYSRLADAAMRHIIQFTDGKDNDDEPDANGNPGSGLSHLAHAACCVLMLLETHLRRPDLDDRYKG